MSRDREHVQPGRLPFERAVIVRPATSDKRRASMQRADLEPSTASSGWLQIASVIPRAAAISANSASIFFLASIGGAPQTSPLRSRLRTVFR